MTQTDAILELLRDHGDDGVTPYDALMIVGSMRLAARIAELRAAGYLIDTRTLSLANGKHCARYVLLAPHPYTGQQEALPL